ncbi:Chaperonin 60 subunit beta 4 [Populus alba x Populus x berolinensis]|uniref:Chaperonin 60 subunit beta 4 n=1 Tax=Populus alba x Populus x berolinensis TaxID=444605 RepID=A0AAD6QBE3_9ROSI|nr:Chaperonin 60 subunit beta 4 [Populus alba x Populus x berolinensis]
MACSPSLISAISLTNPTRLKRVSYPSMLSPKAMAKEIHFNHDGSTTKKLLAGVEMVSELLGVTLGPKGRNVVLQNKYGPPKIVNDGETVLKEIELEDPLENVGVKLVENDELADVAAVSAGNDYTVGNMISDALQQVGRRE